ELLDLGDRRIDLLDREVDEPVGRDAGLALLADAAVVGVTVLDREIRFGASLERLDGPAEEATVEGDRANWVGSVELVPAERTRLVDEPCAEVLARLPD